MIQIILVVFGIFLDMVYGSRLVRFMDIQQPKPQLELVFVMALGVVEFSSGAKMFKVPWTFNCQFYQTHFHLTGGNKISDNVHGQS